MNITRIKYLQENTIIPYLYNYTKKSKKDIYIYIYMNVICYFENNILSLSINLSSLSSCSFVIKALRNNRKSAFNLSPPSSTLHLT